MRIIIIGPPGAGKGTLGRSLARHFRVPHFATGDLLRDALRDGKDTELTQAARVISGGEMVSDDVANALVFDNLNAPEAQNGWILDGYPRTVSQAEALAAFLKARNEQISAAVYLVVREETVLSRLDGRMVCKNCATSFHRRNSPPQVAGICDSCGGELIVRDDDTPSGIARRLRLFYDRTAPLEAWFAERNLLRRVSGEGEAEAVLTRCLTADLGEAKETMV